jgi:hypothetical protein
MQPPETSCAKSGNIDIAYQVVGSGSLHRSRAQPITDPAFYGVTPIHLRPDLVA